MWVRLKTITVGLLTLTKANVNSDEVRLKEIFVLYFKQNIYNVNSDEVRLKGVGAMGYDVEF